MVIWTQSGRRVVAHWALDPWRNERLALSLREVKKKKKTEMMIKVMGIHLKILLKF